jgi:hypothetical protein
VSGAAQDARKAAKSRRQGRIAARFGPVAVGVSPATSVKAADTAACAVRALPFSIFICD